VFDRDSDALNLNHTIRLANNCSVGHASGLAVLLLLLPLLLLLLLLG
jgi:4-hydroxybenzoate polyprenyltransferase